MKLNSKFAALLLAATSICAHAASVQLSTIGAPQAGASFDLQMRLDDPFGGLTSNESLLSFGFHLNYDASQLKLTSFAVAPSWDDDSAMLGTNIFSASNFPGVANQGQSSIVLATLHFDVLQAGASLVNLSTDAGDFNQGLSFLFAGPQIFSASTTVTASPVPEPNAALLILFGLTALMAKRGTLIPGDRASNKP